MTTTKGRRGDGSLFIRTDKRGGRTWYGKVWINGRQVKRRLGLVRENGSREGLTQAQAVAALRALHAETVASVPRDSRLTVAEAGDRYLEHLAGVKGRKPTTLADYRQILHGHLAPFLTGRTVDRVEQQDIAAYVSAKLREGLRSKTVRNHATFAHGLFAYAIRKGWATANPVSKDDLPEIAHDDEIRFLEREELEALYRAATDETFGATDRVLFQTAAMTGLRMGELLALQWRDVDWPAGSIRVRRSFTHGAFSTPKSRKGARAVPMIDRLAGELERHYQASAFQGDDDLVFPHPTLGTVLDGSALRKRFHAALKRAGVRRVRFHDLRHSFGTAMAAAGTPMRALMAMMGHASMQTTLRYADYSPDPSGGAVWAARAFGEPRGTNGGTNLSESEVASAN